MDASDFVWEALGSAHNILTVIVDSDGKIQHASPTTKDILGLDPSAFIGTSSFDVQNSTTFAIRQRADGTSVSMERIMHKTLTNGSTVNLERVVYAKPEIVPPAPPVPTKQASILPRRIIEDFIESGTVGIHFVTADGTIAWANKLTWLCVDMMRTRILVSSPVPLL
jgi:hypothetical protein